MGWLDNLRGVFDSSLSGLPDDFRLRLEAWRKLPNSRLDAPHMRTRYVVVDVEASGLNASRDRLISIGAVAVNGGLIDPLDAFEVVLRQDESSSAENIISHGIAGSEQREGEDPAEAILSFLEYAGNSPLVSYRTAFKIAMIGRAAQTYFGFRPELTWIDLAPVVAELFPEHRELPEDLDAWIGPFGIGNFRRHHAVADSYAMAQLLQVALRRAAAQHFESASRLIQVEKTRRKLRPS